MTTKRCAIYCRVSTSTKDQTTENQLRELTDYCGRPIPWRKKWSRDKGHVLYCSELCRKTGHRYNTYQQQE